MRRWKAFAAVAATVSLVPALAVSSAQAAPRPLAPVAAAASATFDVWRYVDATYPDAPVAFGDPAHVTVTGIDSLPGPVHLALRVPHDDGGYGPVLARGQITPAGLVTPLALPTDKLGTTDFAVAASTTAAPEKDPDRVELRGSLTVTGTPSTITATFPTGSLRAGTKALVRGAVSGPAGRAVQIQAKASNGTWVTLAQGSSTVDGTFALAAPTWWVARQTLRAYAPDSGASEAAATTTTGSLAVKRTYTPRAGTAFSYLVGSKPARWDPCQPITYRVNPSRLPADGLALIRAGFTQISAATGLRFTYAGPTTFVPFKEGQNPMAAPRNADFAIAWTTPSVAPGLTGRTAGLGGASNSAGELFHGQAAFDATQRFSGSRAAVQRQRLQLVMHELGHAVGLGHVGDKRQIMYPTVTGAAATYATGDLRGLAAVGAQRGCFATSVR